MTTTLLIPRSIQPQPARSRATVRGAAAQRGGTAMGVIIGLLIGLGLALVVALYVTRVPVPFVNKVPQRSAEQEAADVERSRQWDPNGKLGGAATTRPGGAVAPTTAAASSPNAAPGSTGAAGVAAAPYVPPVPPVAGGATTAAAAPGKTTMAAPGTPNPTTAGGATPTTPATTTTTTATTAPKSGGADPFVYFVQAGAYTRQEDAEQQRARLAMLGFQAKITEREQVGRTMYRVRLGPFDNKDGANSAQTKLQQGGIDAALVAVERTPKS